MKQQHQKSWTQELKQKAGELGADLIGIAPAERFKALPPDKSPLAIFPQMKSAIVLARRVLRGSLRGIEEGTNFSSTYGTFGYRWLEDNFLAQTTYDLTIHIEEHGFEAVPLFAYHEDGMPKGVAVAAGKPAPNVYVDPEVMAHAAGLGEIGLGDFFITPQFGIRQRFAFILTDAELESDPVREKSICSDCGACAEACPFGAVDITHTVRKGVPGHEMPVATVDYDVCARCPNGAMLGPGRGSRPDRLAAACARACLVQLENAGKCSNRFYYQFRKRTPWALDMLHRPLPPTDSSPTAPAQLGCGKNTDTIGQNQ